ncbi:MAG: dephospho-CoA kinase [Sphingomonadaceae bacterium]|jgi:dephospho-CoA kinase
MKKPIIIGLTGSIGMGKSAVAAMFADEGVPVFDADAVVHELQKAGGALVPAIESAFPGTTGPQGVDRKALGAAVFGDRDRLALLESIVHPAVAERRRAFLESHQDADMILFDIPLLFEKGGQAGVDIVVVVSAPAPVQRERVLARVHMTPDKFEHILALQMADNEKRAQADHVIDTGKELGETRADVRALVKKLRVGLA